jgi:hypothetical protein
VQFAVGCDFDEFSRYLRRIGFYKIEGELDRVKTLLGNKLLNLIVWRENDEIIGHAI